MCAQGSHHAHMRGPRGGKKGGKLGNKQLGVADVIEYVR